MYERSLLLTMPYEEEHTDRELMRVWKTRRRLKEMLNELPLSADMRPTERE